MKRIATIACCAIGSGMIGFFANGLNTFYGAALFTVGVVMLVASIILLSDENTKNK